MVGHYDTDSFAAASFVNNLFALVYVFGMGFSYGLTPLVTKAYTLNRFKKTGALLRHSLVLNALLSALVILLMGGAYFHIDQFELPERLLPIIRPYFLLQLASFVIYMACNAFKQFFDGAGHTAIGMWIVLGSNLVNTLGNYLLIYGAVGFPELGLTGAGISTLASRMLMLLSFCIYFSTSRRYSESFVGFSWCIYSTSSMRNLLKLGLPIGLYSGVETLSFTIALLFVTKLGVESLAVHQILCVVTTIGFLVYYGLGAAVTILVSKYKAHRDTAGVRASVNAGLEFALGTAVIAMLIMFLSRQYVGLLFTTDADIVRIASIAIVPVILYQIGDAMQIIYANALRGIEDVRFLPVFAILVHMLLEPSLSYIFGFKIGLESSAYQLIGVWSAFPIGLFLLGILFRWRFVLVTRD